jgi:hypothetical protein
MNRVHTVLTACLLACASASFAQTLPDTSAAALWRATSRLGYGPTPALVQAASSEPTSRPRAARTPSHQRQRQ